MKNYFYYLLLTLLLTSCYNNLPEANISNIKVGNIKTKYNDQLAIHFTSDVDLDSLHKNANAAMKPWLYCPLDGTADFDIEKMDYKKHFIRGIVEIDTNALRKNNYIVEFDISKGDTLNATTSISLEREEIIDLLKDKECIPCKVYNTFYFTGRKPYFSKQFCIPAKDILKELE
jgi:hypothetical protein